MYISVMYRLANTLAVLHVCYVFNRSTRSNARIIHSYIGFMPLLNSNPVETLRPNLMFTFPRNATTWHVSAARRGINAGGSVGRFNANLQITLWLIFSVRYSTNKDHLAILEQELETSYNEALSSF